MFRYGTKCSILVGFLSTGVRAEDSTVHIFDESDGWKKTFTWDDAKEFCINREVALCEYNDICPDGTGTAPKYGRLTSDHWVAFDPSADGGVKNMVQIGTWTGGDENSCTKMFETHYSGQDRTSWEGTATEIINDASMDWRDHVYCCSETPIAKPQDNCIEDFERVGDKCCHWYGCDLSEIDHNNCDYLGCDSAPRGGCQNTQMGEDHCVCNGGYHLNEDGVTCDDVDECTEETDNCIGKDAFTACVNKEGSFQCVCDASLDNFDGYKMVGKECRDIDECEYFNLNSCADNDLTTCNNSDGTYTCECMETYSSVTTTLGHNAFEMDGDFTCANVNECANEWDDCHADAKCTDHTGTEEGYTCACHTGYADGDESNPGRSCTDIDECAEGTDNCGDNATCTNNPGYFACHCNSGYTGDGITCTDIDECGDNIDECDVLGICTNIDGDYNCECPTGYAGSGYECEDIDECTTGDNYCHADANCINLPGSFMCFCKANYRDNGDGDGKECEDINECAFGQMCHDNAACHNVPGAYYCDCDEGHQGKGHKVGGCTLCSDDSTWASEGDDVTEMEAVCTCNDGYEGDGDVCEDIDECDVETDTCDDNATCANTIGSYTCTCNDGYYGFGEECTACDPATDFTDTMVVECEPNSIGVTIPYCAFWNAEITDATFLELGDDCLIENTGINMEMSIPANEECGTTRSINGTYIVYENAIVGEVRDHYGDVTRKKYLELEFSCGFESEEDITLNEYIHALIDHVEIDLGRQEETFNVAMGVFTDDTYEELVAEDYSVVVPDMIHAGISLMDGEDALILMAEKCWATPTSDPEGDDSYVFLDNFCGTEAETDGVFSLKKNAVDRKAQFELQSFEFIGHLDGAIYLHCHAIVCDTEIDDCTIDCGAEERRRRRRRSTNNRAALHVGPIRVVPRE